MNVLWKEGCQSSDADHRDTTSTFTIVSGLVSHVFDLFLVPFSLLCWYQCSDSGLSCVFATSGRRWKEVASNELWSGRFSSGFFQGSSGGAAGPRTLGRGRTRGLVVSMCGTAVDETQSECFHGGVAVSSVIGKNPKFRRRSARVQAHFESWS